MLGVGACYLVVPLAVYGAATPSPRRAVLLILLAPAAMVSITAMLTYGSLRLRHAAELPLIVLAAVGLSRLADRRRRRPSSAASPGG